MLKMWRSTNDSPKGIAKRDPCSMDVPTGNILVGEALTMDTQRHY